MFFMQLLSWVLVSLIVISIVFSLSRIASATLRIAKALEQNQPEK